MATKVSLVNMPFASLSRPSIGLTQLKSVTEARLGEGVKVSIEYLNLNFGQLLGKEAYELVSDSTEGHVAGLGEWLFRQAAFPELKDNSESYFLRYARQLGQKNIDIINRDIKPIREQLSSILDNLIIERRLWDADIVGMTSMFFQNVPSVALARRLRIARSDQVIVMGGANCEETMGKEWVRQVEEIDFIFSGHGLVSFPDFVSLIAMGEKEQCHGIRGVYSRKNASATVDDGGAGPSISMSSSSQSKTNAAVWKSEELDIDEVVPLDYEGYLAVLQSTPGMEAIKPEIPFETSRGCWWGAKAHCTFCGLNGGDMAYRAMKPTAAVSYINDLFDRYATRVTNFECVDNIMPREYFEAVFKYMRPPHNVSLFYEVKADLSEDQVRIMRDSNIKRIQPGIESLSTSTLKLMRKGTTAFGNVRLLLNCRKYGITPLWNLLVGFPGEQANVYEEYLRFLPDLFHCKPPEGVFPVRFDRFSPYFVNAERFGLSLQPYEYYSYCLPFSDSAIRNIAYFFEDQNYDAQYIQDLASFYASLRVVVEKWQARWNIESGQIPPSLLWLQEASNNWVIDTRGQAKKIPISQVEKKLLLDCICPVEEVLIRKLYGEVVDRLKHKRLLFCERGRVMSLISDTPASEQLFEKSDWINGIHEVSE